MKAMWSSFAETLFATGWRLLPNSRLQLAAKPLVRLCLGATRDSLTLATIVLLAPVWHACEFAAWTNGAAAEA